MTATAAAVPVLRPLTLPTEHGGWGFLFEPLVLAMIVAPSWCGALLCAASICAFLTRQPLKLAMQDLVRGKRYPRTRWCALFASSYAAGAAVAVIAAIAFGGWRIAIPFAIVAPLAIVNIVFDARNKSRTLLPEITGPIAMASSAAAIAIAGGKTLGIAFALMALIVLRGLPAIVYVRTLLARAHGRPANALPPISMHVAAIVLAIVLWRFNLAPLAAAVMLAALLARAAYGLARPVPPAKTIGWREIVWGAAFVAVTGFAYTVIPSVVEGSGRVEARSMTALCASRSPRSLDYARDDVIAVSIDECSSSRSSSRCLQRRLRLHRHQPRSPNRSMSITPMARSTTWPACG
jgi:hypothetical protein